MNSDPSSPNSSSNDTLSQLDQLGQTLGQSTARSGARAPKSASGDPSTGNTSAGTGAAAAGTTGAGKSAGSRSASPTGTTAAPAAAGNPGTATTNSADDDEALPALPERQAPGYLRYMPPLVQDLWARGAEIAMDGKTGEILIEGFYRNGAMRLIDKGGAMVAIDKQERETPIKDFEDLALLNFRWWKLANGRTPNATQHYVVPNRPWLDLFVQRKWATRKVIYVPAEDGGDHDPTKS